MIVRRSIYVSIYLNRKAPATAKWSEGCQEFGKQSPPATSSLSSSQRGSMAPTASSVAYNTDDARNPKERKSAETGNTSFQHRARLAQKNIPLCNVCSSNTFLTMKIRTYHDSVRKRYISPSTYIIIISPTLL